MAADRPTRPAEWAIAIGGGLALAALLVWFLRGPPLDTPVETTAAPPPVALAPPPQPPPALPQPTPEPPAPALSGFKLRGIVQRPDGAAAIIEHPDGRQRLVRIGTEILPGVRLDRVGGHSIELVAGTTRQVLGFGDTPITPEPETDPATTPSSTAPLAKLAASAADYRLGLKARKQDGRTTGFTLVEIARLPLFRQAGLQPGDVILSINGTALQSEEKIMEIPNEVSGAYVAEITYERDGKTQSTTVNIDRKP